MNAPNSRTTASFALCTESNANVKTFSRMMCSIAARGRCELWPVCHALSGRRQDRLRSECAKLCGSRRDHGHSITAQKTECVAQPAPKSESPSLRVIGRARGSGVGPLPGPADEPHTAVTSLLERIEELARKLFDRARLVPIVAANNRGK